MPLRTRIAAALPTGLRPRFAVVVVALVVTLACPGRALGAAGEPGPVGVWPLDPVPEVVAGFDPPSTTWGAGHRGVDLLGSPGQPVRAAMPGTVSFVGRIAGLGIVVVDHGATRTTYEPVSATVDRGAVVAAGRRIGTLEAAGSHCPPRACLHWGWIRGDTYLDPLRLVGAGPVRLLPLWRDGPAGGPVALPYAGWRPAVEALGPWLGPGVRLLIGPAEPVGGDVGVELGRRQ